MKLGRKILLLVLGPALAAVVLGSIAFSSYSTHIETRQAAAILLDSSEAVGNEIDEQLRSTEYDLDLLLASGGLRDYFMYASLGLLDRAEDSRGNLERFFLRATASKKEYITLRLIDLNGMAVINIIDQKVSYQHPDFSSEEWFHKALQLKGEHAYFAPPLTCQEHGKPGISIAKAYRNEVGEVQGIASLHIHLQGFFHELLAEHEKQSGAPYLVNGAGIIVAHPNPERIGLNVADHPSIEALLSGHHGTAIETDEIDGIEVLKAYRPLSSPGLNLVISRPMGEIMAAGEHFRLLGLLVVCLPPLLVGIAIYLFGRSFRRPLMTLQRGLQMVGSGDLNYRTALTGTDEFALFSRDFDGMVQRLQDTLASRDELNREIEEREKVEYLLRQFKMTLDRVLDCIFIFDPQTLHFTYTNNGAINQVGYSQQELMAMTPLDIKPEFNEADFREVTEAIIASPDRSKLFRTQHKHKDGHLIPVEIFLQYIDLEGGENCFVAVVRDIRERVKAEEQVQLLASVFSHINEGVMITDPGANILDVNEAFTLITGYGHDEAVGKNSRLLQSGRHDPEFYQTMWQELTEQGHWQAKIWNRRKNREIYAQYLSINAVNDDKGQVHHYVGIFSDITHQIEHEQQMEHLAHFDALTDLPNRVLLADRLQQAMTQTERRGKQLAIIFLDLDGFKEINDNFGHKAGDHLLTSISSRLLEALREGDTVARLGGDEFAAVLIDMENDTNCVPLLERLLETASHPVHFGDQILQVSASIGVTFYPQADSIDPDQLLRQADQAMYQAKLAGKNCYQLFDAEMDRSVRGHHGSVEHIRQALDTGEFILYYQPKVNMRTGEVVGAEALIRWQHPEKGLLSPDEFLPVIENDPTSLLLDAWVINEAVSQLGHWHRQGAELSVSVNISSHNIQQPDFFSRFKAQLDAHPNLDSRFLELEVLETSALEDLSHASDVIKACAEIGIHFALDDFGTGYSSLTYLKQLPASVLKVDRSFVRDMLDDPEDLAILEGIIGLASAFRRQVVAEGVETLEHGKLLLQLGCELAQGYGIANPMPGEDLPDWITEWRPHPQWTKQYPVSRDDHAVLFAISEHRAWIRNFAAFLNDESDELPPVDISDCQFSKWIKGSGRLRYDSHPAFNAILKIHQQVHSIAAELYQLYRQEQRQEAIDGLNALYEIRDALLMQMELLLEDSQIRDSK